MEITIQSLDAQITLLEQYLLMKFYQRDWHGVADAAMDLRELEVERKHMATKFQGDSGGYDKAVSDSGDAPFGGSKQDGKKFTKSGYSTRDPFPTAKDKGNPGSVKYSGEGKSKDQHSNP